MFCYGERCRFLCRKVSLITKVVQKNNACSVSAFAKVDSGYPASEFFNNELFELYSEVETYFVGDERVKLYGSGMAYGSFCPNLMTLVVGKKAYSNVGNCNDEYKVQNSGNKLILTFDKFRSAPKEQFIYQNGKVTSKILKK